MYRDYINDCPIVMLIAVMKSDKNPDFNSHSPMNDKIFNGHTFINFW